MPVLTGRKTDSERFAGALRTYSCEALMQDNKALQAGTSHNLGQNFVARVRGDVPDRERATWTTCGTRRGACPPAWSARLIMTHSDDAGLVCPPRLAQYQVVIVPIYRPTTSGRRCSRRPTGCAGSWPRAGIRVHLDAREGIKPGAKYYEWEGRGVPLRLEVGPRDVAAGTAVLARRTGGKKETGADGRPRPAHARGNGADADRPARDGARAA